MFEIIVIIGIVSFIIFSFGVIYGEEKLVKNRWDKFRNEILTNEIEVIEIYFYRREKNDNPTDMIKIYFRYIKNDEIGYQRFNLGDKTIVYRYNQKKSLDIDIKKKDVVYLPYSLLEE